MFYSHPLSMHETWQCALTICQSKVTREVKQTHIVVELITSNEEDSRAERSGTVWRSRC
jgi:hypothetical protein